MMLLVLFVGTMALSLWAAARVKSVYRRYNQGSTYSGMTGAEAAREILRAAGIHDVSILAQEGMLGDHYDPLHKRLVLSHENYYGVSPAALGVAAHECGHAIQHKLAYAPLQWRMAAVGITSYASQIALWVPLIGLFTGLLQPVVAGTILAAATGIMMLFNLVALPVEFDASRRAKALLGEMGMVAPGQESVAVNRVLNAAAWTYVAASITSFAFFLWHLLPLLTSRERE